MTADREPPSLFEKILAALLCRGDLSEEDLEAKPCSVKDLFRYASCLDVIYMIVGFLLSIATGAVMPLTFILGGLMANEFLIEPNPVGNQNLADRIWLYVLLYGIGIAVMVVLSFTQQMCLLNGTNNIVCRFRREFLAAVMRQDAQWQDEHSAGEISNQLNENIDRIRDGLGEKFCLIIRGCSMFLTCIIASFIYNWKVTIVMCGVGPLSAVIMGLMGRFGAKPLKQYLTLCGKAASLVEEVVMNVKTVSACNGEEEMVKRYRNVMDEAKKHSLRMYLTNGFFEGLFFFILYVFTDFGMVWGVIDLHRSNNVDPGSVIISLNGVIMGAYFLGLLGPHMMALLKCRISAAVMYSIIDRARLLSSSSINGPLFQKTIHSTSEKTNEQSMPRLHGRLDFADVHFKYPTRENFILKGLTWTANPGQIIAFVGHSGCGKSTSIGLLTRLYSANEGKVFVDGKDITEIDPNVLRTSIGIVQQEPYLFNGTIRDNVEMGRKWNGAGSADDRILTVLKIAHADDFVSKLDKGMDTPVGDGAVRLSGGQKQRIAIARALFTDPPILVLDEATSALDVQSERLVQEALYDASRGRTTISIAHRLSTLKDCDRIYVLDKGKVTQAGSHDELVAVEGLYVTLAKAQSFDPSTPTRTPSVRSKHSIDAIGASQTSFKSAISARMGSVSSMLRQASSARRKNTVINEEEETSSKNSMKYKRLPTSSMLRMYTHGNYFKMLLSFICSFIRGWEMPLYALLIKLIYRALNAPHGDYANELVTICMVSLAIGVLMFIFITFAQSLGGWSAECVVSDIKERVLGRILAQNAEFFDKPETNNATVVSDINQNSQNLMAGLDHRMVLFVYGNSSYVILAVMALVYYWRLALIGIASSTILLILVYVLFFILSYLTERQQREDVTPELAIEMIEQTRTIQLMAVEKYFLKNYSNAQKTSNRSEGVIVFIQAVIYAITQSAVYTMTCISYGVGRQMLFDGTVTSESLFSCTTCIECLGWVIIMSYPAIPELIRANLSATALYRFYDLPTSTDSGDDTPALSGSFTVSNVVFSYPSRPDQRVANYLSLSANSGESIALVGPSGCGKSTIIGLLERYYDQQSGLIKLDGVDHRQISRHFLRSQIALVGQEPVLFQGSIAENVSLGCTDVSMQDIIEACKMANAVNFIESLPSGYDTDVGERGRALSGGQKQRIAIARALIRKPKLLLLDEATSALDSESEKLVQAAINSALHGRTSISIAHRLASIQSVTRIYFIEGGSVVECGSHDDLIQRGGRYAAYVEAQTLGEHG